MFDLQEEQEILSTSQENLCEGEDAIDIKIIKGSALALERANRNLEKASEDDNKRYFKSLAYAKNHYVK